MGHIKIGFGGGGVMFWPGIIGNDLVGPFRVSNGVKMTA